MTDRDAIGYVFGGLTTWFVLVLMNGIAMGGRPKSKVAICQWIDLYEDVGLKPREVYAEFYWGLVLPVVAGSGLYCRSKTTTTNSRRTFRLCNNFTTASRVKVLRRKVNMLLVPAISGLMKEIAFQD